ncbi:MAG TPA: thioredoxin family protein [Candidatus Woesebacteria bacterium]|nr:thioredoxin family protein [Candidatus Woesebacteria bacterium]HNS94897.1 thioredoxin family protein [Candidatus Woesebacteria bacterium]
MKEITLDSFKHDVVAFEGVTFLVVETEWCEPCKQIAHITDKLSEQFKREPVQFLKLDLDKNRSFTAYYQMKGLPTVIIFQKGVAVETLMGIKTVQEYQNIIKSVLSPAQSVDQKKHNVTVFSTPTCPYCHMVKDYLRQKNVAFKDVDVAQDQSQAMKMVEKSGQMGVPQLWIDDEVVVGFNRPEINRLLSL